MRAIIQRVTQASVTAGPNKEASIPAGLLVFLGIEAVDNQEDIDWLIKKVVQLRIFNDHNGIMNRSLLDVAGELLIVSQFTLHAQTRKGNRPSYIRAAPTQIAQEIYDAFIAAAKQVVPGKVKAGFFGEYMQVSLVNDGPVTLWIDTRNKE